MKHLGFFTLLALLVSFSPALAQQAGPYCGDGMHSPEFGEECDDGNFFNRDGCSNYCEIEDLTPPEVSHTSIPNGQTDVSTLTKDIKVSFNEAMDPDSFTSSTVKFKQFNDELPVTYEVSSGDKNLTVHFQTELEGDKDYTLLIEGVKDALGNMSTELFYVTFYTGAYTDVKPPNIVVKPKGGLYHVGQSVTLTPYLDHRTYSDEFIDEEAVIRYTLDGSNPGTHSPILEGDLSIKQNTTLKYYGTDEDGNVSKVETEVYEFDCGPMPSAKEREPYPSCKVLECNYGYKLQGGICIIVFGELDDYQAGAATAPLFGSDTAMTIATKPALYITPEHEGIIPRPLNFVDRDGGGTIRFERDTKITKEDGSNFYGYILPPDNLYSKSFPLNFGYSFKSIFNFAPAEGDKLSFNPMIEVTVPFTDRYDEGAEITVFTYDANTEEYFPHDKSLYSLNDTGDGVKILADSTETFFVAQPGQSYNAIVFKDTIDHWSKNYIEQLYRWDMVKGRSKGVFAPNDVLTRAEFTKITLNAIGEEVDPFGDIDDSPFYDVPLYAWYAPYIKRAKDMGLIKGYPDGSFQPDSPINRVEAVKMLTDAFGFDVNSAGIRTDKFKDIPTWEWYFPALNFAHKNKLIDGIRLLNGKIQYDTFGPGRNIKRGEMAKLAVKAIELKNESED